MKRWILAVAVSLSSFAAFADEAPAPAPDKTAKPAKKTKKKADAAAKKDDPAKKDDAAKKP